MRFLLRTALWLVISNVALSYHSFGEVSRVFEKFFVFSSCAAPSSPPAGTGISLKSVEKHGIIKTDEPRTLDFSGVRGFLVTNVCIVQRSAA